MGWSSIREQRAKAVHERFWEKVHKTDTCWVWVAALDSKGYGYFHSPGLTPRAHRIAYSWTHGPIPEGMQLDHLCRNRACVNPDHLEPVSPRENLMRSDLTKAAANAGKTHCPQGHEYTPANTRIGRTGNGGLCRNCRACARIRAAKRRSEAR